MPQRKWTGMANEETEFWQDYKSQKKEERLDRDKTNRQLLESFGVKFEQMANPTHVMMTLKGERISFWPSTGRWYVPRLKQGGHGLLYVLAKYGGIEVRVCRPNPHEENHD